MRRPARRAYAWLPMLAVLLAVLAACSVVAPGRAPNLPGGATPGADPSGSDRLPPDGRPLQKIPDIRPFGFTDPPPGAGLGRYEKQKISWRSCAGVYFCADVVVPLDYDHPDTEAITLVLAERRATGPHRLGSLFINPGGPGGSGRQYVAGFDRTGLEDYDIVGWDPRGVGGSTPVDCYGAQDLDRLYSIDVSPDDAAELDTLLAETRAFGQSCLAHSGALLEHISTTETVRDLDLLRGLVGDPRLNYFGASYGTDIGALYAQLFPSHVGRMVLDGAVDITEQQSVPQIEGFEHALDNFAGWCVTNSCAFGSSRDDVLHTISDFLNGLDAKPIPVGTRMLTQQLGVQGVLSPLYDGQSGWKSLRDALQAALTKQQGGPLLQLADLGNRRFGDGSYDQLSYSFPAIRCLDSQDTSVRKAEQDVTATAKVAPILGRLNGADFVCPLWPVAPAPKQPLITGAGAPPILVVGTEGDPATPYAWAQSMAKQLTSGVLLTYDGEGHTGYGSSGCIRDLVRPYLLTGRVPAAGIHCPA